MIIYAEITTDFKRTTTEIQTTPFLHPGPNVTIGEHRRKIYVRVFKKNDNENKKLKKSQGISEVESQRYKQYIM